MSALDRKIPPSFSRAALVARGLAHYWKINLTVMLAAAVGVAVLTGSLLVGSSVRGSLRAQALSRLGRVDEALLAENFFREALAASFPDGAGLILTNGSAVHAASGARASKVQALGVTGDFWKLGENNSSTSTKNNSTLSPNVPALAEDEAAINGPLARALGAKAGDDILLRVQKPSAISRETFIGERDDTVVTLRLKVARVRPDPFASFSLGASQFEPLNIFVPRATLQRRLAQGGMINAILAGNAECGMRNAEYGNNDSSNALNPTSSSLHSAFRIPHSAFNQSLLARSATLEDAGVRLRPNPSRNTLAVENTRIFLPPYLAELTTQSAAEWKATARPTLTYLANTMRVGAASTPYSMVTALDDLGLKPGEIALNEWLAADLGAKTGDKLALGYYLPAAGRLTEATTTLTISKIIPLSDPLCDRALTPDFPGLKEATQLSKWHPPFPLELKRIRRKDEDYWNKYKTTPKAFVSLATGQALWSSPFGNLTSLRIQGAAEPALRKSMMSRFDPARAGLHFDAVRARVLGASGGASDFGGLFIGFSLFLLVSAAMLIRILFQLGVQSRAREVGLLGAVGFPARAVRRLMLAEGARVAAAGALTGVLLGLAYAALMLHGLRTWWVGAVGTPFLRLFVDIPSLAGGAIGGWLVAMLSIWLAARRLSREPARALLAGRSVEEGLGRSRGRVALIVALIFLVLGAALAAFAPTLPAQDQAGLFFGAGACLLVAALAAFRLWLRRPPLRSAALTLTRLGVLAARRRPGRSMLVAGLMASAAFLIVAVGANRQVARPTADKRSGAGGFTLLAESAVPLYKPLDPATLGGAHALALRLRPGDDASCLNLYRAAKPRVIGAPPEFVTRGGFVFASSLAADAATRANPWLLLDRPQPDGAIPVIGDYNSVVWLMHSGLGKTLTLEGRPLRFVGLLQGSVFQGEPIVSEANFKSLFPGEGGWRMFAIETVPDRAQTLAAALESKYEDAGLDAVTTAERLNALLAVENTYLATFQALGGLGLLLGTLGLALALARNLLERRAELALLRAVGYRFGQLLWLAVAENLLLLLAGLLSGALCALIAVAPAALARSAQVPWASLALTMAGVLAFGVAATVAAAAAALKTPLIWALKVE